MILRSSSTPVLGSLLVESPCNNLHSETSHGVVKHLPTTFPQNNHKLPFRRTGSINFSQLSCNSPPISPSITDFNRHKGFRRAQSEGNLHDLAYASCNNNNTEEPFCDYSDPPKRGPKFLTLQRIPSFSLCNSKAMFEESDTEDEGKIQELEENNNGLTFENRIRDMILTEEVRYKDEVCSVGYVAEKGQEVAANEMYLARGLGVDGCGDGIGGHRGGGGSGDYNSMGSGRDDGDRKGVEEYYKKMVEKNPGNALFLRNYAQFLYQCKQDHEVAEEYYSRAILADPMDGGVLSDYAKLLWELHRDQDRATSYFERAVQASPEDSHVQAAYASFLWDTEADEDNCNESPSLPSHFHQGALASVGVSRIADKI